MIKGMLHEQDRVKLDYKGSQACDTPGPARHHDGDDNDVDATEIEARYDIQDPSVFSTRNFCKTFVSCTAGDE
eukprot:3050174-Heterocapsa_arctica.AAC.1